MTKQTSTRDHQASPPSTNRYKYSTFQQQNTTSSEAKHANPIAFDSISSGDNNTPVEDHHGCCETILSSYIGPRLILTAAAAIYATNFVLGALMDEHLPPSAATAGRMTVAALALSPLLRSLNPRFRIPSIASGLFSGLAYITQSRALVSTNPARVSFLGSATVLVVPALEAMVDRKPMGLRDAPQTWLAALLCFAGVGVLELHPSSTSQVQDDNELAATSSSSSSLWISSGDILALIQAFGFGTSCFINNKMLRQQHSQALPVTSVVIGTTAVLSWLWSLADGWVFDWDGWLHYSLPGMLLDPALRDVAGAVLWTGLVSTSFNYSLELTALGRMPPSEASVILASEPLWAACFAALLYHTPLSISDCIGGLLIVSACIVNATLGPAHFGCQPTNVTRLEQACDEEDDESSSEVEDEDEETCGKQNGSDGERHC